MTPARLEFQRRAKTKPESTYRLKTSIPRTNHDRQKRFSSSQPRKRPWSDQEKEGGIYPDPFGCRFAPLDRCLPPFVDNDANKRLGRLFASGSPASPRGRGRVGRRVGSALTWRTSGYLGTGACAKTCGGGVPGAKRFHACLYASDGPSQDPVRARSGVLTGSWGPPVRGSRSLPGGLPGNGRWGMARRNRDLI